MRRPGFPSSGARLNERYRSTQKRPANVAMARWCLLNPSVALDKPGLRKSRAETGPHERPESTHLPPISGNRYRTVAREQVVEVRLEACGQGGRHDLSGVRSFGALATVSERVVSTLHGVRASIRSSAWLKKFFSHMMWPPTRYDDIAAAIELDGPRVSYSLVATPAPHHRLTTLQLCGSRRLDRRQSQAAVTQLVAPD